MFQDTGSDNKKTGETNKTPQNREHTYIPGMNTQGIEES